MKQKLLWAGFAAVSLAAVAALFFLPDVFGGLKVRATLDRGAALALADKKAQELHLGPADAQQALVYANDDQAQAFVELQGGGLAVLNREAGAGTYTPATWTVRRFREGEIREVSLFFSPSGTFLGWNEKHPESEVFPNLGEQEARDLALQAGRVSGVIDLLPWTLVETSSVTLPQGRTDWTFVWKKPASPFGEGEVRWTAVVAGNQVSRLERGLKVPEAFQRWYQNERSVNNLISTGSLVGMGALLILALVATLRLNRTKSVAWKRSWVWGALLGLGAAIGSFNALGQAWMSYDTALPAGVFWATQAITLVVVAVVLAVVFGLSVAGADAVYRRAFPTAFSFGTPGSLGRLAPATLGRQVAASLLAVPLWLLAVTAFYAFTKSQWGWWTPASGLADPNIVGQFIPWLTPLGNAVQAAVWEELLFRALPLGLAAWAGQKWGRTKLWVGGALILQAVVFAAGHASYPGLPGWSRLVELIVPALAFGLILLRWGLIPAILIHFGYDFVLMSQPLFATDSAALIPDRIAVVLVALSIPGYALWNRYGRRTRSVVPAPAVESAEMEAPVDLPPVAPAEEPVEAEPTPTRSWPWLAVVAAAGIVVTVLTWQPPVDTLKVDRAAADAIARKALQDQGFVPGPEWTLDVTAAAEAGDDDRYVRSVGGDEAVRQARSAGFIKPPRWIFQWSNYTGDLADRERWWVTVAQATGPLRVSREVPEGRAGARLTRDEALTVAEATLPGRLGVEGATLELVSAVEASRPNRSDWTLEWKDKDAGTRWEGRYQVVVTGDRVTDASRYVFVPEDWTRAWQQTTSMAGLINLVAGLVLWVLLGWAVVRGFRAWSAKRIHRPLALATFLSVGAGLTLTLLNNWTSLAQGFNLAESWFAQAIVFFAVLPVVALVMGLIWALLVGGLVPSGTRWALPPWQRFLPGLAIGLAFQGGVTLFKQLVPLGTSVVPDVSPAAGLVPWLGPGLMSGFGVVVFLAALFLWDRANAWWNSDRRWQAVVLVLAVGLAFQGGVTLFKHLVPLGTSVVPDVSTAAGLVPWLGPGLMSGFGVVVFLAALFLWDRANAWWNTDRRWQAVVLVLAVGLGYSFGLPSDSWQTSLFRMAVTGPAAVALWFVFRKDLLSYWVFWGTTGLAGMLVEVVQPSFPGAGVAHGIGVLMMAAAVVGFAGWLHGRKPAA